MKGGYLEIGSTRAISQVYQFTKDLGEQYPPLLDIAAGIGL